MSDQNVRWTPLFFVAGLAMVVQLIPTFLGRYGYFIDEFYYLACANRMAWGYIDHPPLAPGILALVTKALGSSLPIVRLIPAICGAATALLAGRLAARLGATTGGQLLAALTTLFTPTLLVMFGFFSTNALDILLWLVALSLLLEIELGAHPRLWIHLGIVLGLAQMTKHTGFTLAIAVALAALVSPIRRHYTTRWPWIGGVAALLIVSPNIWWEVHNDWLTLEFARNAYLHKNVSPAPLEVLWRQVLFFNPGTLPLWLGGLVFLLSRRVRSGFPEAGRWVGWTCLLLLLMMMLTRQGRPDRIAAVFPVLFAAGAVLWTRLGAVRFGRAWQFVAVLTICVPAVLLLPLFYPVLTPSATAAWNARLGFDVRIERGAGKAASLPQWLADRLGWEAYVADVTSSVDRARTRITEDQARKLIVIANSYGHAGALELFGRGLPSVYCTQNNYILWGPPEGELDAIIVTGDGPERLGDLFEHVELLSVHDCEFCMSWRDQLPIWLVWGPRIDLQSDWMELRHLE